ncbi:MAG: ABC transporter substrate-binding protein [Hyphomicrobiales bacterium]|nr:ABC transporter substrate-binding protein [Hyphomicrobiales bacterium]
MRVNWIGALLVAAPITLASTVIASAQSYELIQAAKEEGALTTIALPHDWCGYGDAIAGFKERYRIRVNETAPDASSAEQLEAIRASAEDPGPEAPDVVDIGLSFADVARDEELLQPFKVGPWDSIPDEVKDPDGYWYGDYYGVIAFEVNAEVVESPPQDWSDLLDEAYKGKVALAGDPRTSAQAALSVYAAGLATGGAPGTAAGKAGLAFFADLNAAGNFVPEAGSAASLIAGETPIVIRWDYAGIADRDSTEEPTITVVVPKTGVLARPFVQAISANAPHPNAARLWMEYLYSDDGQLAWLKGNCHPIRFPDLVKYDKIPASLAERLPPAEAYGDVVFPSLEDQAAANTVIVEEWDATVGAGVN